MGMVVLCSEIARKQKGWRWGKLTSRFPRLDSRKPNLEADKLHLPPAATPRNHFKSPSSHFAEWGHHFVTLLVPLSPPCLPQARAEMSQEGIKIPSDTPSASHLQAFQGLHCLLASLTCVLVTQLLTGISGPLSTQVSHPGGCGIDLIVQGQLGWVKPIRDVQVAPLTHNEAAA